MQTWTVGGTTYMFGGAGLVAAGSDAVYLADMWRCVATLREGMLGAAYHTLANGEHTLIDPLNR